LLHDLTPPGAHQVNTGRAPFFLFKDKTMLTIQTNRPIYHTINDDPRQWNAQQISEFYDRSPDLLLSDLARFTGRTVKELKKILMGKT